LSANRTKLPVAAVRLTLAGVILAAVLAFAAIALAAGGSTTGCFSKPSACGYPDASNTGVRAGTTLTQVKSVTLTSGQTLENKEVTNGVTVAGSGVTIRNSVIRNPSGGNGTTAIEMQQGATNFTIEHSEVTGNGSKTNSPESNVWNHWNDAGFRVIGSYLHGVPDNIEGSVAEVRDSFIIVDAEYSGAHSEDIYLCGANATVKHSTLYNESDETSLIFGDGICGKGNAVTVEDSMLAGGGYMLQPNAKGVSAPVRIVDNRVGRCLTTAHQDSGGGYVCGSGGDANGYWPRGGHYGLDTELGKEAVWSGNVWDDNSQPMCPTEKAGCAGETNGGGVTPPTEETGGSKPTEPPEEGGSKPSEPPVEGEPIEQPSEEGGSEPTEPPSEEEGGSEPTEPGEGEPTEPPEEGAGSEPPRHEHPRGGGHSGKGGKGGTGGSKPSEPSEPTQPSEEGGTTTPTEPTQPSAPVTTPPASTPSIPSVVGAVTEAVQGAVGGGPGRIATAIWNAPSAWAGGPITLDGTDSRADGPISCVWALEGPTGRSIARKTGCVIRYRFLRAGVAHVTLTVLGRDGSSDRSRKAIVVQAPQSGQARVASAARVFD
jgi:hypothetical protein